MRPLSSPAARPGHTRALGLVLGAAAALAVLPGLPAAAAPAPAGTASATAATGATEVYAVPADRVLRLRGHGYGHGRGMSQWGSQGAALQGVSAGTILDTYYPGTAAEVRSSGRIRVALTRAGVEGLRPTAAGAGDGRYECDRTSPVPAVACRLEVLPAPGLTARLGTAAPVVLPAAVAAGPVVRWRVVNEADGLRLQHLVGTAWGTWASSAAGPVEFDDPAHVQQVRYDDGDGRDATYAAVHAYRGTVSAVRVSSTRMVRVNTVALEDYLRSVVPKESPPSWAPASLQAQSVAARSYATHLRQNRAGRAWEICDSTSCQVYTGSRVALPGRAPVAQEQASTDAAVARTAGEVRTYRGAVVRAEFSSSNGGFSTSGGAAWLPAKADPWDAAPGNTSATWSADLPASALEARFGLARLDALAVLRRDGGGEWGGRVLDVELRGLDRGGQPVAVRTTGAGIVAVAPLVAGKGLRSAWFRPAQPSPAELTRGAWATEDGTVALAARTPGGGAEAQTWTPSAGLGAATALSGRLHGAPALAARRGGPLEVFVRGGDDAVWTRARTATGWTPWTSLGGVVRSRPSAARGAGDDLHVFGTGKDGRVWQRSSSAPGTWSPWTLLGGTPAPGTGPAAVATGADRLDVVVTDAGGGVSWRRARGGTWGSWKALGGDAAGDPAVASAAGELTVVVRRPDGGAATRTASSGDAWRSLGGVLSSDPAAAAVLGSGRLDLLVTGTDGRLWGRTRTAQGWTAWSRTP